MSVLGVLRVVACAILIKNKYLYPSAYLLHHCSLADLKLTDLPRHVDLPVKNLLVEVLFDSVLYPCITSIACSVEEERASIVILEQWQ